MLGRRGHPAVTHGSMCLWGGHPQPDGAGGSHQEQSREEGVGDNPSPRQAPHLPATPAAQGRGRSPGRLPAGSEQTFTGPPRRTNPHATVPSDFHHLFGNLASQPSGERLPVLQQQLGSIFHPSICPSIHPGNGLNSPYPTPRGQPGLPGMEGRG